ncbi:pyridoxamine 5'-phosphate oxidase [Aestuariispira insulae]|uniref:Pyridoxine/pyridoxamine 5'-phosphate oxidase n=1 Tax=Aestuariispira insulae TaxID=1461337 RepID=A0A3D9HSD0_9PROT|nr:pyridoxamine 5'-phosphate oxidase [Aestuariispira insulae]RED52402.1 pyridoxamine 5'-phosphate oxidase [Aestuariispira insulae]
MELNSENPFDQFKTWLDEAGESEPNDPNAMALATADANGQPSLRMVLLKGFDERGFVFYTNLESHKGRDLAENPQAALLFHWKSSRRQVRVEGPVVPVSAEEADAYFHSRPRGSQIGAWASEQSRPLESKYALEKRVAKYAAKFGIGTIPRPDHWSGFRIVPNHIEFWQDGKFRLHDRFTFTRQSVEDDWVIDRLYP